MSANLYFGDPRWTKDHPTIKPPVALFCVECEERIATTDSGVIMQMTEIDPEQAKGPARMITLSADQVRPHSVALHEECFMRNIVGSVGHQTGRCSCFGGDFDDPPGMSKRDAAKIAYTIFLARQAAEREGLIPPEPREVN
jgi:hypothetical protein